MQLNLYTYEAVKGNPQVDRRRSLLTINEDYNGRRANVVEVRKSISPGWATVSDYLFILEISGEPLVFY